MTEKRFNIEIIGEKDVFIKEEGANYFLGVNEYVNAGAICSLLNELNDENEQLKKELDEVIDTNKLGYEIAKSLKNENEELKKENKRLYEDNIRVKQLITDFYNNERTAIGRSVIQQILEAL